MNANNLSLSKALKEIEESLYDALFIATHIKEAGEDESVNAKAQSALRYSLTEAEERLDSFKKILKSSHKIITNVISQEFIYDFEICLKSVCKTLSEILKTNYAHKKVILSSVNKVCLKSNALINELLNVINYLDNFTLLKLKNLNGSPFYGSFENLKDFNDKVLGGKYARVNNLKTIA